MDSRASCHIFVLSHLEQSLAIVPELPFQTKVHLPSLDIGPFQSNQLGESRAFFLDFDDIDAEYLGFANARWNQKYFTLHTRIETLHLAVQRFAAPGIVLAPWTTKNWYEISCHHHPGMSKYLVELLGSQDLQSNGHRQTLWANDFICHRSVFYDWLRFWRTAFDHFYSRYGFEMDFEVGPEDEPRKIAFFLERFSAAYFANRADVVVAQLP